MAPINLIGKTFFKQAKLYFNGTEVFDSGDKYSYRAFIETELNYGSDAKDGPLKAAMYYKEEKPDDVTDGGYKKRQDMFKTSKWVQLIAPIHCDLFAQDKYLLNYVDVRLVLSRNSDAFCLTSDTDTANYQVEVQKMRWMVKAVDVRKDVSLGLEQTLQTYTAKYPVRRVEVKSLHVSGGRRDTPENALFNGQLPRRMVVGCVDADAYHGNYKKSPFNFKNYKMEEFSIQCGGETFPSRPLTMDFPNGHYARAFIQLFEGLGLGGENKGNGIDYESFKKGSCLFAVDLSPDEDDGTHWDLVRDGSVSIYIRFGDPIPAGGIEVVAYAEFDNLITIDRNRNTYTDYRL